MKTVKSTYMQNRNKLKVCGGGTSGAEGDYDFDIDMDVDIADDDYM